MRTRRRAPGRDGSYDRHQLELLTLLPVRAAPQGFQAPAESFYGDDRLCRTSPFFPFWRDTFESVADSFSATTQWTNPSPRKDRPSCFRARNKRRRTCRWKRFPARLTRPCRQRFAPSPRMRACKRRSRSPATAPKKQWRFRCTFPKFPRPPLKNAPAPKRSFGS